MVSTCQHSTHLSISTCGTVAQLHTCDRSGDRILACARCAGKCAIVAKFTHVHRKFGRSEPDVHACVRSCTHGRHVARCAPLRTRDNHKAAYIGGKRKRVVSVKQVHTTTCSPPSADVIMKQHVRSRCRGAPDHDTHIYTVYIYTVYIYIYIVAYVA